MPGAPGDDLHKPEGRGLADCPGIEVALGFYDGENQVFADLVTACVGFHVFPVFACPDMQMVFFQRELNKVYGDRFVPGL